MESTIVEGYVFLSPRVIEEGSRRRSHSGPLNDLSVNEPKVCLEGL